MLRVWKILTVSVACSGIRLWISRQSAAFLRWRRSLEKPDVWLTRTERTAKAGKQ